MAIGAILSRLAEMAQLMVGLPSYRKYREHMLAHHPEHAMMTEQAFFRDRQEARYGGKHGGRCC